MGKGFFPLDEELELLPGILTPHGHEMLVRLSGWMPFAKAAELFEDYLGIVVSKSVSQRYAEEVGAAYEALQNEEVKCIERELPPAPPGAEKMQISADGAMVPLLHGQWAEVRTLVVGEVQPAVQERGEWVVHTRKLSYFSRKVTAQEFERLALVEVQRRGLENAHQVGAIMDGSDWLQGFTDYHCPQAVRILDFPHAGDHISQIGEFLYGEGTPATKQWINVRLHQLKQDGPAGLLAEFQELQAQHPAAQEVSGNLAYLQKREQQMQYPLLRTQGWPIGSGIVESGNKLVVEARLKGSGMHWAPEHVNPMLAIRNILCSDRWKEDWPKVTTQLRQQTANQRWERQASRRAQAALKTAQAHLQSLSIGIDIPQDTLSLPEAPIIPKKPKDNPWRHFKYGRALYQRSDPPKK